MTSSGSYVVRNAGAVVTMNGGTDDNLGLIEGGAVWVDGDRIRWVGPARDLPHDAPRASLDAAGGIVLPGLIDCHTHLLFAGSRSDEFAMRSRGATYAEIMAAGGGIRNTTLAVRAADEDELVDLAEKRVQYALSRGVTTLEVKSGYGLSRGHELKCLRAIRALNDATPADILSTCLAAHAIPPEFDGRADEYISVVCEEILPAAVEGKLADAADVFIEKGAFNVAQGRRVLETAKALGLRLHVHVEQLSHSGGAQLAAELGAHSVGHLEFATEDDAAALAEAGVVAEVLTSAQVFLGMEQRINGAMLRKAGVTMAVATDLNPGSAMSPSLHLAAGLAITMSGLTADEALLGITKHAAMALGIDDDRGTLAAGKRADLCVLDCDSPWPLVYEWAVNHVVQTVKDGAVVHLRR